MRLLNEERPYRMVDLKEWVRWKEREAAALDAYFATRAELFPGEPADADESVFGIQSEHVIILTFQLYPGV